jgi:hypothetical protein
MGSLAGQGVFECIIKVHKPQNLELAWDVGWETDDQELRIF